MTASERPIWQRVLKFLLQLCLIGFVLTLSCYVACRHVALGDALIEAARTRDHGKMRMLLKVGANPNYQFDGSGETPLMESVRAADLEGIQILLDGGADINFVSDGKAAIDCTADIPTRRYLVEHGSVGSVWPKLKK